MESKGSENKKLTELLSMNHHRAPCVMLLISSSVENLSAVFKW